MSPLLNTIKKTVKENRHLPFAVYTSIKEQNLRNVPIAKPLLIVVLSGVKELGKNNELICHTGQFIFLADSPAINMRNIPKDDEYFSLLIEFEHADFNAIKTTHAHGVDKYKNNYCIGETTRQLEQCLQQFIECCVWAPESIWTLRKREIIELLCHLGHQEILSMVGKSNIGHRLHDMFCQQNFDEISISYICNELAMSESTLRRKLALEGSTVQEIKDQAKLGLGLHLLQTTKLSVAIIAQKCGYQSPSRFTDRFKGRFGLTPSALRKTKMAE
ncbi:MAG: helix-turn-helix transcriptional regulator [Psychrobium sp.]|nr:helix-turn-helix transcriptional regulator [Psychrobium sp.]